VLFSSLILRVMCMVGSGQCGRAGLSIGSADRLSHQPLARAIVRSQNKSNTCADKSEDGVGDYDDAFSPVPAASRFRTILIHNKTCSWTTSMVLRPLFRENYCPETVTMARCTFFHLQDMIEVLSTCIASLSHFTACPLQPELATPP